MRGHAMGGQQFAGNGTLIDMADMSRVLNFDAATGLLEVEARWSGGSWQGAAVAVFIGNEGFKAVMYGDYGCDDIEYLIEQSPEPDTIQIEAHGKTWTLPICRFDNRVDKTTFLRGDPDSWPEDGVKALHEGLEGPMQKLWAAYAKLHG